ncbi:MAG: hypothetical protein HY678_04385 [Chloroflexi bacterium]|nr:hypothetical protein [Chloroflexota bacterium]
MPTPRPSPEELARRAAELGFKSTAEDYRRLENRLGGLQATLDAVRALDVLGYEPASTFGPQRYG